MVWLLSRQKPYNRSPLYLHKSTLQTKLKFSVDGNFSNLNMVNMHGTDTFSYPDSTAHTF